MSELLLTCMVAILTLACWVLFIYARAQLRKTKKIARAIDNQNAANSILVSKLRNCQIMADVWKLQQELGIPSPKGQVLRPQKQIIVPK